MSRYKFKDTMFVLTEKEHEMLALKRAGKPIPRNAIMTVTRAVEKARLILLAQKDKTRPGAATRLDVARGAKRSVVDVRKGAWKTG